MTPKSGTIAGVTRVYVGVVVVICALAATARAQTDDERARLHFNSGSSDFAAGAYEDALREFQRSYELSHREQLQYNFALCYERLANLPAAAAALERFLSHVTRVPDRANLEDRLRNWRASIAAAERAATTPPPPPPPPTESAHTEVTAPPLVAPPPPAPAATNVAAIVGFSVAALGVVGVGVFGGLTLAADSSLSGGCGATHSCSAAQLSDLHTWAAVTDVSFGVALAGAVVGLAFLLVGTGPAARPADHARLLLVPTVSATHGGVVLTVSL